MSLVSRREYLHCVSPIFVAQTASGETYYSDSRILLLDLQQITSNKTGVAAKTSALVEPTSLPIAAPAKPPDRSPN